MIKLQIATRSFELDDNIRDYLEDKIGALDKYLPRTVRSGQAHVTLSDDPSGREDNKCVCEVVINIPNATIQAKEATINMYAAIDIAEAKLKAQILKYKEKQEPTGRNRAILSRLWRDTATDEVVSE
jgi:putative sigma-54 modulation protein